MKITEVASDTKVVVSKSNRNRNRNRNRNQRCQWYVHIAMLRKLLCLLAHFESAASCTLALLVE